VLFPRMTRMDADQVRSLSALSAENLGSVVVGLSLRVPLGSAEKRADSFGHLIPVGFLPAHPSPFMIRQAFVMSVNPGHEQEYERRHRPIWPELEKVLKDHGVHNYSIFLHPGTRQLFAYAEIEDEARWSAIAATPECQRWWIHMGDVMPSNPDHSPVATTLREVFHID